MMSSESGRVGEARTTLESLVELDPTSATALSQLGELELHTGDSAKAVEHLKRARDLRPNDDSIAFMEAQALKNIGDLTGARETVTASLKLAPAQFAARLFLGELCLNLKDPKAAKDQFEAALLLQPQNVQAQLGMVKTQISLGEFPEPVRQLESLAKSQTDNAELFEALASGYRGLGRNQEAQWAEARGKTLRKDHRP